MHYPTFGRHAHFICFLRVVIGVYDCLRVLWLARQKVQKIAPLFQPVRGKTKANGNLLTRVFRRLVPGTWIFFRDFKIQRRGRQQELQKKTIGLISTTTTSHVRHTVLYISFPFLHDYDVKMPHFAFYGGRKQATTKFFFSFWAWIWSLEIQLQEGSPTIDKVSG